MEFSAIIKYSKEWFSREIKLRLGVICGHTAERCLGLNVQLQFLGRYEATTLLTKMADMREKWRSLALQGESPAWSPKQAKAVQTRARKVKHCLHFFNAFGM